LDMFFPRLVFFSSLLPRLIAVAVYQNYSRVEVNIVKVISLLETLYEIVSTFPGWQCDWTQGGMKEGENIPAFSR
jgi:hypothetical protein